MNELLFLGLLSTAMGFITSVSGGGGVFGVPAMMLFGIPPLNVLALNRVSDLGVLSGAIGEYKKAKSIRWELVKYTILIALAGAFIGAKTVVNLPEEVLNIVILVGILIAIFFLLQLPIAPSEGGKKVSIKPIGLFLILLVGIWSGGLAMAGGTFGVLVMVYFFNVNFVEARSSELVMAVPETILAACILLAAADISLAEFGVMFGASFIGAFVGSKTAIKKGDDFIRKMMIIIAFIMIVRMGLKLGFGM